MNINQFKLNKIKKLFFIVSFSGCIYSASEVLITLHADDSKLSRVLSAITEMGDYNIVTGPSVSVEENISIHLNDVPLEEAINLVVRAAGLSYEIVGKSILIAETKKIKDDVGVTPYLIHLKYAKAREVSNLLINVTNNITVDSTGNKILINASPKKISEIKSLIEEIDVPAIQIMLEAKLIEVNYGLEENIGIDWARLAKITNVLAEGAKPYNLTNGGITGTDHVGSSWVSGDDGSVLEGESSDLPYNQLPNMPFRPLDDGFQGFSRQLNALDVTLDMLLKNKKAEVLANSKIVTLNGHMAEIRMTDLVPFILSSGGIGGQVQTKTSEVGIKLRVTPTVNIDGYITTEIIPEVSSIYDLIGPDRNVPWVKRRISSTKVRVKDGETIITGGLIGVDKSMQIHRVPLLWRIPYIGERFFVHRSVIEQKSDLIIQITPHIIRDNYTYINKNYPDLEEKFEAGGTDVENKFEGNDE